MAQEFPQDLPGATTLSAFILAAVAIMVVLQFRLLAGRSFVTVTGRGFAARSMPLGRWRWLTLGLCIVYFLSATVLPVSVLVLGSFMRGRARTSRWATGSGSLAIHVC
jgi:iron(III) transport system permease protein